MTRASGHQPTVIKQAEDNGVGVPCPVCGLVVREPGAIRCPRCYSPLLAPTGCSGNCSRCLMKSRSCSH